MANPSKARGTRYENEVLDLVREIWPDADRAKTNNPTCDIVGTDLNALECKHRKTWSIPEWVRKIREKGPQWALFIGDGDRRRASSAGDIVVFSREFAIELLDLWADWQRGILTIDPESLETN